METTRENLPAVLRLIAEVLREPAFPADEFEQLRSQRLAQLEEDKSEPQAIAVQNLQGYLRPFPRDDIRYIATTEESIAETRAVTLDEAKRFYTDFYGASNGELSVVGDFDAAEVTKLVTELLGSWKSPKPFTRLSDSYRDVAAVNRTFETPDKANAFFLAGINMNVRDDDPEYAALVLGNYMLGGGFLNSRLATRVRQKDGLSYGVGLAAAGQLARQERQPADLRHLRAAERRQARDGHQGGSGPRAARRLHRRRGEGRQGRLAAVAAGHARAGRTRWRGGSTR